MNFWRQTTHIMSYFKEENFRGEKSLPTSFMAGFLEVCHIHSRPGAKPHAYTCIGPQLDRRQPLNDLHGVYISKFKIP